MGNLNVGKVRPAFKGKLPAKTRQFELELAYAAQMIQLVTQIRKKTFLFPKTVGIAKFIDTFGQVHGCGQIAHLVRRQGDLLDLIGSGVQLFHGYAFCETVDHYVFLQRLRAFID